ncbi:hypothetical protein DIPPA_09013 [Diplonema papillatum]|nr:hypothetical protein DIPPA_09013 [Diplonema papillatum]
MPDPSADGWSVRPGGACYPDGPPAYGVRRFSPALLSNSATHGQGGSPQQGKTSPFYSHHTPSPPPLCTPNPTPPVPTPPPGGSYANTSPSSYPQPLAPIPATPTTPTAGYQSAYQQPYQPAQSPMTLVQPAEQQARGLTSPTALGTGAKCVAAVSMKYGRKGEFVSTANHSLGECVVVETPKGIALGTVTAVRAYSENDARNGKVMRVATPQEFQLWAGLGNHEQIAMQRLVELAALCGLSQTLLLHQCEYPYDSTSLLVHCSKASRDVNLTYYLEQAARLLQCAVSVNECDAFITQAVRLVPPSIT